MLPIAIIGAGIAGLSCAARLQHAGHTVHVYEKSRAVGGRLARRRLGSASVDLGAQYCTAHTAAFRHALVAADLSKVAREWRPRLGVWRPEGVRSLHDGQPQRWVGAPSMRALAEVSAGGLNLILHTRVAPLPAPDLERHRVCLQDVDGRSLGDYRQVLIATPAEQAAALLVQWPHAAAIAAQVRSLPCIALGVRLAPGPVPVHDALFGDGEFLSWLAAEHHKPGRSAEPCWIFHAAAAWSAAHLDDPDAVVTDQLWAEGARQAGLDPARRLECTLHRWRYARSSVPLEMGAWLAEDGLIGLAGDWLAGDRMEGAWTSGQRLADLVLNHRA